MSFEDRIQNGAELRPESRLLVLYLIQSLFFLIFMPFIFIPLACKYYTLRYRFNEEGIHMSYGILFRRENLVRYRRIQDLHLSRGILERWLGLGKLDIQTASGSAGAEMSIVGFFEFNEIRDFLYNKMRGSDVHNSNDPETDADEVLSLLVEIRDGIRDLNERNTEIDIPELPTIETDDDAL